MQRIGLFLRILSLLILTQNVQAQSSPNSTVLSGTIQLVSRSPTEFLIKLSDAPALVSQKNPILMIAFYDGARHDGGSGTSYWPGMKSVTVSFGFNGIPRQNRDLVLFIDQNGDYLPQDSEPQAIVKNVDPDKLAAGVAFQLTVFVQVSALPESQSQSSSKAQPLVIAPSKASQSPALQVVDDPAGTVDIRLGLAGDDPDWLEVVLNRLPQDLAEVPRSLVAQWTIYGRGVFTTSVPMDPNQFRYALFIPTEAKTQLDQFVVFLDERKNNLPDGQKQSWTLPGVTFAGITSGLQYAVAWTNPQATIWPAGDSDVTLAASYPGYQDLEALTPLTKLDPLVGRWARIDNPEVQVEFLVSKAKVALQGSKGLSSNFAYRFNSEPTQNPGGVLPDKGKTVGLQVWNKTVRGGDASPNESSKVIALWFSDLHVSFQVGFNKTGNLVITEDGVHVPDSRLYSDFGSKYNQLNPGKHRGRVGVFVRQPSSGSTK